MAYQNRTASPAPRRTKAGSGGEHFETGVQSIARRLLFSAVGIDQEDREFLHELARDEHRYHMRALQRLIAISGCSVKPEDREALAELVRSECLAAIPVVSDVALAFDLETAAQGEADMAQRRFERQRCRSSREIAIEKLTLHSFAIRASIDAVQAAKRS